MGAYKWRPEDLQAFEARRKQWEAEGTIRTHTIAKAGEGKPQAPGGQRKNGWLEPLLDKLSAAHVPAPILELQFHPTRKWRFDLAWPDHGKVCLEVEGGIWIAGRHSRGKGMEADMEKYAEASLLGWRVFRASVGQVRDGTAVGWIKRAIGA